MILHLPISHVTKITRYRFEHPDGAPADPRANNLEDMNVTIGRLDIDPTSFKPAFEITPATGGVPGGMPPGGVYLYVFEW